MSNAIQISYRISGILHWLRCIEKMPWTSRKERLKIGEKIVRKTMLEGLTIKNTDSKITVYPPNRIEVATVEDL